MDKSSYPIGKLNLSDFRNVKILRRRVAEFKRNGSTSMGIRFQISEEVRKMPVHELVSFCKANGL